MIYLNLQFVFDGIGIEPKNERLNR